ncbi:MAG: hypothetical protein HDR01_15985 [Lachnospiraceae bacterium]|nr:hypothetical protein [Lachnospiraceae bacterium]
MTEILKILKTIRVEHEIHLQETTDALSISRPYYTWDIFAIGRIVPLIYETNNCLFHRSTKRYKNHIILSIIYLTG